MLLLQIDPWPAVDFLLLCSYHRPQMVGVLVPKDQGVLNIIGPTGRVWGGYV